MANKIKKQARSSVNKESEDQPIQVRIPDADEIIAAVRKGYIQAVREHRAFGLPMVFWKDGKVVWIPSGELPDV